MNEDQIDNLIEIETLLNAQVYEGKPNPKAILGKIMSKQSELRSRAPEISARIQQMSEKVSLLTQSEITKRLSELDPEAISNYHQKKDEQAEKRREQKKQLPELKNAIKGKVVVRYAPDPSKYPHLGQGMNYLVNRLYADKYEGKVNLRFDDTNPSKVDPIFYDAIKDGMMWLGAKWDKEYRASQFIDEFYEVAEKFIEEKKMFVCLCDGKTLSLNKKAGKACSHRRYGINKNLELFRKMKDGEFKPGDAVIRLRGNMKSDNYTMRDPVMFRLVSDQHPMLDKMYYIFPTYDFESAYLDNKLGTTHIIRSGEFGRDRIEQQSFIITMLGGKIPEFKQFGRFNVQGSPTKGRVIRELVEKGIVSGWDDIRLLTLIGLRNRGIHPETVRVLIEEAGLTPKSATIPWSMVEKKSRELLERDVRRLFFVQDPILLNVKNSPEKELKLSYHPDHPEFGKRPISVSKKIWVAQKDLKKLKVGDTFRLKELYNVKIQEINNNQIAVDYDGNEIIGNMKKIQWVSDNSIKGQLLVPDLLETEDGKINENSLYTISGKFESNIKSIKPDEVIQLERVGYAKITTINNNEIQGHIVHLI